MSAIAGVLRFDGGAPAGWLTHVVDGLAERAQDGFGTWVEGPMALAHGAVHVGADARPEARQPLVDATHGLTLVMEGRLDNRDAVRSRLRAAGIELHDVSDAALVLAAFACWRDACVAELLGDFVFAVWDARTKRLFCATDAMGAKSFHYVSTRSYLAFASDEEALIGLPGVPGRPNPELLASVLAPQFHTFAPDRSWVDGVMALGAAQSLTVSPGRPVEVRTYWQIEAGDEIVCASDADYQAMFLDLLTEAVRCRVGTGEGVAMMLSGGIDSAAILAALHRLDRAPAVQTYSVVHDQPQTCPESARIALLAQGRPDARYVQVPSVSGVAGIAQLNELAWSRAHPNDNGTLLPALMCMVAARDGHRVILHGAAGDLVTDVPDRYMAYHMRSGEWGAAWREAQAAGINNNYLRGAPPSRLMLLNAWSAFAPAWAKTAVARRRLGAPVDISPLLQPDLVAELRLREKLEAQEQHAMTDRLLADNIRIPQARALAGPRGPGLGSRGYGRVGARFGIETRDPFADRRVAEFLLRIPLRQKVRDGWTKFLVRSAIEKSVGGEVSWRIGKEHLGWHLVQQAVEAGHAQIADMMAQGLGPAADFLEPEVAKQLFTRYAGRVAQSRPGFDADRQSVYEVATLAAWIARIGAKPTCQIL